MTLSQSKKLLINIVIADSTTFNLHQYGSGVKEGSIVRERVQNYTLL